MVEFTRLEELTISTSLPQMPSSDQILKPPNKQKYRKELENIKGKLFPLRQRSHQLHQQIKEKKIQINFLCSQEQIQTYKLDRYKTINNWQSKKSLLEKQLQQSKRDFNRLRQENAKIRRQLSFQDQNKLKQLIASKQNRMQTQSLSLNQQKKLFNQINKLKKILPTLKSFKDQKTKLEFKQKNLSNLQDEIQSIRDSIKSANSEMEKILYFPVETIERYQKQIVQITREKQKCDLEIKELDRKLQRLSQERQSEFIQYREQRRMIKYIEIAKRKQEKIKYEEELKEENRLRKIEIIEKLIKILKGLIRKQDVIDDEKLDIQVDQFMNTKEQRKIQQNRLWINNARVKKKKNKRLMIKNLVNLTVQQQALLSELRIPVPKKFEQVQNTIEALKKVLDEREEEQQERIIGQTKEEPIGLISEETGISKEEIILSE